MAVVRAEHVEQVQTCLRWATEHAVAVVPRGRGTGLAGGAPPSTAAWFCHWNG